MLRALCFLFLTAALAAQTTFDASGLKALDAVVEKAVAKKNPAGAVVRLSIGGRRTRW